MIAVLFWAAVAVILFAYLLFPALIFLRRVLLTAWLATRADSDTAQSLGGPAYTLGTLALADRFLTDGLVDFRP